MVDTMNYIAEYMLAFSLGNVVGLTITFTLGAAYSIWVGRKVTKIDSGPNK